MINWWQLSWWGCASLVLAALCAGCASQAPMVPPKIDYPSAWSVSVSPANSGADIPWWDRYGDPKLGLAIRQVLGANGDLLATAYRVQGAKLQSDLTRSGAGIGVGATAGSNHVQDLLHGGGGDASSANVVLSYEVDVWGKMAHQQSAAQWQAAASQDDCDALALSLSATVATLYWQMAQLNQLIAMAEADIEYARQTLDIIGRKLDAGAVSGIARAQAAGNLANQQAALTRFLQSRAELRHAMATLMAKPPQYQLDEPEQLSLAPLPPVQADIPAEVLGKRPDLHAAEMRLRAIYTNIDVVRSSLYPRVSLTGGVGTSSGDFLGFAENPVALIGAMVALPILQADAWKLNIQVSEAQYRDATQTFQQRLYTALTEVEDALSAREQFAHEYALEQIASEQAAVAEKMVQTRYRAGFVELQWWLDARLALRNANRALVYTRFNQLANEARLYKALGAETGKSQAWCAVP